MIRIVLTHIFFGKHNVTESTIATLAKKKGISLDDGTLHAYTHYNSVANRVHSDPLKMKWSNRESGKVRSIAMDYRSQEWFSSMPMRIMSVLLS